MEKNQELSKRRKRRHGSTNLQASLGEDGMVDHGSNVLENKPEDWNRGLRKKRKRSRYESSKNGFKEGDDDRRIRRSFEKVGGAASKTAVVETVDELVIGVPVPRRTRSVTVKRLNRNWSFRNAGFGGGLSQHRRFLPSEVAVGRRRVCRETTANLVLRENKKSCGPKSKVPEGVGDSSLVQDDEFEVVEALFDLMNQSHSELDWPKKNEIEPVRTSRSHKENVANKKSVKTSWLPRKSGRNDGLVKKGADLSVPNDDLIVEDGNNLAWSEYSEVQSENLLPESAVDVSVGKDKAFNKRGEELFNDLKRISGKKRVVAPQDEEFPLHANQNSDKQVDSVLLEGNPAPGLIETQREAKFQIDSVVKIADDVVEKEQENNVEKSYLRQGSSKLEQCSSNRSGKSELVEGGEELKQCKAPISGQNFALPNSLPSPSFGIGWPRGLPYPGFMPPFQIVMPDRNAPPLAAYPVFMQHPPFLSSQPRRKRCLTHQYIAHNILCHQQLIKNLTTLPVTAGPASIYTSKAPMPDAMMSKQNKHQPVMVPPTNQNAAALLSNSVEGALGSSLSSLVASHDHVNHLSKTIPPYMTIFPNNGNAHPFSNTNT